VTPKLDWS